MSCINELEDRLLAFLIGHGLERLATAFALARVEISQSMTSASVNSDYTQARAGVTTLADLMEKGPFPEDRPDSWNLLDSELGGKMPVGPFYMLRAALRDLRQDLLDEAPPIPAPGPPGPPEPQAPPAPPNMQLFWLAVALLVAFLCGIALENARNTHNSTAISHACRCGEAPPDGPTRVSRFNSSYSLNPSPVMSLKPTPCPSPPRRPREWDVTVGAASGARLCAATHRAARRAACECKKQI